MDVSVAPEYFFAKRQDSAKRKMAKRICGGCVELQACRDYALEIIPPVGVFGAMDEYDRYRISHVGASRASGANYTRTYCRPLAAPSTEPSSFYPHVMRLPMQSLST